MGLSQSDLNIRSVSFDNPSPAHPTSVLVSTEVLERLHQSQFALPKHHPTQSPNPPQPPSEPQKVPDVGGACCCLHVPLHRPTVSVDEVQKRLEPIERAHASANAEWERREEMRSLSEECQQIRQQLIAGYLANLNSTLNCSKLCRDYEQCLWEHRQRWREQIESPK